MPPKSKRRVIEEDSDDGILDDKEESEKPKHKKTKIDKPAKRSSESEVPGGGDIDDEGAVFWEVCVSLSQQLTALNAQVDASQTAIQESKGYNLRISW